MQYLNKHLDISFIEEMFIPSSSINNDKNCILFVFFSKNKNPTMMIKIHNRVKINSSIAIFLFLVSSLSITMAQSNDLFSMIRNFDRYIPVFGSCDRIVYAGVANCMSNFGPSRFSKGSCCASRKYRACIQGLKDGHSFAVARDRCPPRSLSMPVVWAVSDRLIGLPLSSCPKNSCRSNKPSQRG
uniref:Uncharacterized protein LOC113793563 n=1 Tax=Dermatophagoides pteronyssinus TaxID=6956 RepID=A0A6P6Y1N9_DERPT|nr:uncharacterized protein LOC113793563 [Dermatophagoides pteronyssinus]